MISEREFNHDGDEDFTGNFTASADQDYITLFIYPKGQDYDEETVGKNAARAIVKLFPHNFAEKTKHRTYQTDNGKNIIFKPEYSPAKRIPSDPEYQAINRFTMLRLAGGPTGSSRSGPLPSWHSRCSRRRWRSLSALAARIPPPNISLRPPVLIV
jgi:hypothetical protein